MGGVSSWGRPRATRGDGRRSWRRDGGARSGPPPSAKARRSRACSSGTGKTGPSSLPRASRRSTPSRAGFSSPASPTRHRPANARRSWTASARGATGPLSPGTRPAPARGQAGCSLRARDRGHRRRGRLATAARIRRRGGILLVLRGEHVMARLVRGRLIPHKLPTDDERATDVAETLVALYANHAGKSRASLEAELALLEEELGPRLDPRRGFRIVRALAKLLEEKAAWAPPTEADPYTLRTRLFDLAAALPELPSTTGTLLEGSTREDLLSRVAGETGAEDPVSL